MRWPPDVTKRQSRRDMQMLMESWNHTPNDTKLLYLGIAQF